MAVHPMLAAHLRSRQVARVVYGSIIGLALVFALEDHPPAVQVTIGSLLATAIAVALAELYSELIGSRARASMGESAEPLRVIAQETVGVGIGIAFPTLFFFASALGVLDYVTAFSLAKWTGLGLIAAYGYLAARLAGATVWQGAAQAAGVASIAAMLIAVKSLLH